MSCCTCKCVLSAITSVDNPWAAWYHLLRKMCSHWVSQKLLQGLVSHELTAYRFVFDLFLFHEMAILSKGHKPDNFESHNSLKLKLYRYLKSLFEFCWMWIFPWIKLFWYSPCETNLDGLLILTISLSAIIFLWSKKIVLLICMVLQFI